MTYQGLTLKSNMEESRDPLKGKANTYQLLINALRRASFGELPTLNLWASES